MLKHLKNSKGFTLIELLITLAVLGIVIMPLSGLLINSLKINNNAKALLEANNIAQTYMENLKAKGLAAIIDETQVQSLNQGNPLHITDENYEGYRVETDITPVDFYSNADSTEYTPDVVLKVNEAENKLSIYKSSEIKLADLDLQPEYTINIEKLAGTNMISISGLSGDIVTTNSGSAIIQIIVVNPADVALKVNNNTNMDAKAFVVKTQVSEASNINITALTGKVQTQTSVLQSYNNNLYEIQVTVKKEDKVLTTMKGSKLIEFK